MDAHERRGPAAVHQSKRVMLRSLRIPPAWHGYRWIAHETVQQYIRRTGRNDRYHVVHAEAVATNPLPCNITAADQLPDDRGWWGYSFRDVPQRVSGETFIATIPDCRVTWYRDPARNHDFYPAILTGDGTALTIRELRFRPLHGETLRRSPRPARVPNATWVLERVYHNHSHWLTAHLPKLLLLQSRQRLDDVLLPSERSSALDDSLRLVGIAPERLPTFDVARPLQVDELTIVGTDRFRPELLRLVSAACGDRAAAPRRRVFISRAKAARRRLVNEEAVWAVLQPAGFERVQMEDLTMPGQAALMRETAVLLAPHGAGLTNMMFCPPGAHVIEMADLTFPNPNFYALASAMRHNYWLVPGEALGDCHPLEKDLRVDPEAVRGVVQGLPA